MVPKTIATSFALLLAAHQAPAQSGMPWQPGTVTVTGRLGIGAGSVGGGSGAFVSGDAMLDAWIDGGPFGVSLGYFGHAAATGLTHETYATANLRFGDGTELRAGVPRPGYDHVATSAIERLFPALGVDYAARSRSHVTVSAMSGSSLPVGLLATGEAGGIAYALSLHNLDGPGERVVSLALSYDRDGWTVEAAGERVDGPNGIETGTKARIAYAAGRLGMALAWFHPGSPGEPDRAEMAVDWRTGDRLVLTGFAQVPMDGSGDVFTAVGGQYDLAPHRQLTAAIGRDEGGGMVLHLGLDWRF